MAIRAAGSSPIASWMGDSPASPPQSWRRGVVARDADATFTSAVLPETDSTVIAALLSSAAWSAPSFACTSFIASVQAIVFPDFSTSRSRRSFASPVMSEHAPEALPLANAEK